MITITKTDKVNVGGCNGCTRDFEKPFAVVYEVSFHFKGSNQSHTIRLCQKCLRELKREIGKQKA